jgi:hypothetical protein
LPAETGRKPWRCVAAALAGLAIAVHAAFTEERYLTAARTFTGDRITETIALAGYANRRSGYIRVVADGTS